MGRTRAVVSDLVSLACLGHSELGTSMSTRFLVCNMVSTSGGAVRMKGSYSFFFLIFLFKYIY